MKPYELIAALMHLEGIGPDPLAKRLIARKLTKRNLQSPIHRFINGETADPKITTADPLAKYFGVPLDALYKEKDAAAAAKERGVTALTPEILAAKKRKAKRAQADAAQEAAEKVAGLSDEDRQRFWALVNRRRAQAPLPAGISQDRRQTPFSYVSPLYGGNGGPNHGNDKERGHK